MTPLGNPGPTAGAKADVGSSAPSTAKDRPTVLVVDDEPGYREGISRVLASRGYPLATAEDGARGLERFRAGDFPIVLVDLKMPGLDGFGLIRAIKELRPQTLCVVVSAFATIESAVQTTKLGAFDFVVKPFAPDELLRVVDRAAEKWRLASAAEQLRAERDAHLLELAAEKSRLRTIIQAMGDGLLVINIDGIVVLDNPVARRLLGRVQEPVQGARLATVLDDAELCAAVDGLLSGSGKSRGTCIELRRPAHLGEEERFLKATVTALENGDGRAQGVVIILTDITEAKALERMKTRFISMVAHELKSPLAAVEGYLDMMKGDLALREPARVRQIAGRCMERTSALLCLIGDLLEITRHQTGQRQRQLEQIGLLGFCRELVTFHQLEADKKQLRLVLEGDVEKIPSILVDKSDLERVIGNLLSNAIKYNRPGGAVWVRLGCTGSAVVIEVQDTGIGMSDEERARIGEEFFRAKNADTRGITGTGLGLALVTKIVGDYNGLLEVESVREKGSTFRVLLPLPSPRGAST
jgi:PAS domain S-box-containing protein